MQVEIQEINIEGIKRDFALELKNEINKATNGKLAFMPDEYPALTKLYALLKGNFDSSVHGVHFISSRTT